MPETRYEFHPEGDVVLILHCPVKDQGPEIDQQTEGTNHTTSDAHSLSVLQSPTNVAEQNSQSQNKISETEVVMLVSSAHLKIASPVFKAMLQAGCFKEGQTLQALGKFDISLPDDDVHTFELLMNIIHNRARRIPRQIDLQRLTDLSIVADKYQISESLEVILDMWMPLLRKSRPDRLVTPIFFQWLSLSWIFNLAEDFKHLTQITILESDGKLKSPLGHSLPFPESVINEIEEQRQLCIRLVLAAVQKQIDSYTGPETICSFQPPGLPLWPTSSRRNPVGYCTPSPVRDIEKEKAEAKVRRSNCDGMMLGTFLKSASLAGLWPLPIYPYDGHTPTAAMKQGSNLRVESLCHALKPHAETVSESRITLSMAHGSEATLSGMLDQIYANIVGLDIEIFKNPSGVSLPALRLRSNK